MVIICLQVNMNVIRMNIHIAMKYVCDCVGNEVNQVSEEVYVWDERIWEGVVV